MKKNERTIEVLNDLIRINIDRVNGYEKAAHEENEMDPGIRTLFYKMAMNSRAYINELHAEILHFGGAPVAKNTISGKIYLFWMEMKAGLCIKDARAFLATSEESENAIQKAYEYALRGKVDLPENITKMIGEQRSALKKSFDLLMRYRVSAIMNNHH